ncbi:bacteriohemerythrin [Denitromonas iodatirespirans]|uniref:Hemerythrin family protein n=1 Tax=Denitromonas iodatirespirans TaxID=2795389 RepID=A0A944H6U4_DENI1|nr:hemerythrin family protein [Denitromonas iodatirespirans]MBT0960519.1 hemerythrin family protein [Denitromonas iodatirespirans]
MLTATDRAGHALGVTEMDDTHRTFVGYLDALAKASEADFPGLFHQLLGHTRKHFERETQLMHECSFPAIAEHGAEHARVLADLTHLAIRVQQGNLVMARTYVSGLPDWFRHHLATMDSALAARLKAHATHQVP